jgi:ABC-type branched-subunit amino acid transport system ATPase component
VADGGTPVLALDDVSKRFGGVQALTGFTLRLDSPGRITAIIGPNGAGKSTLFQVICGHHAPDAGRVAFRGVDITGWTSDRVARQGIGRTFQETRVFPALSALANVLAADRGHPHEGLGSALWRRAVATRYEGDLTERARAALDFVGLGRKAQAPAGTLSYGEQKLVALAQLLLADVPLLLLDEPAGGVRETMVDEMGRLFRRLAGAGKTILLIEHNLTLVRSVADWAVVLDAGVQVTDGPPGQVLAEARVLQAYLGQPAG